MKSILNISIIVLLLLSSCETSKKTMVENAEAQEPKEVMAEKVVKEIISETNDFPEGWIGEYEGNLEIWNVKGKTADVNMKLVIDSLNADGIYPWAMYYGDKDARNYGIKRKDSSEFHFIMDEFNGILIDGFKVGPRFISHFSVGTNEIISSYEKRGDQMLFEIISSSTDTLTNTIYEEDENFKVGTFFPAVFQRATLEKKKTLSK